MGDVDGRGEQHGLAHVLAVGLDEVGRRAQQQLRPSSPPSMQANACRPVRQLDLLDDLAAGRDPARSGRRGRRRPRCGPRRPASAVGGEAELRDHLRHRRRLDGGRDLAPDAAVVQRAVGGDRERASAARRTSRPRSACRRRSTIPFGNHRSSASTRTEPSGSTRTRLVPAGSAKFMMSKPKLPVYARPSSSTSRSLRCPPQCSVRSACTLHLAVGRAAQQRVLAHRDDQQRAVRHPARARTAGPRPRAPAPRRRPA